MSDLERDRDALLVRVTSRTSEQGRAWLEAAREELRATPTRLEVVFPGVTRRVGREAMVEDLKGPCVRLNGETGPVLNPWTVDQAARVVLLLDDAIRQPEGSLERASKLYFQGDARERVSVLRGLSLLPDGEGAVEVVRDALRANAANLFAAAICENDYASRQLSDEIFYQGVLKAVFIGIDLERIERVGERTTPELARMLWSYVTEREHAGRPVAADLFPLVALHPPAGAAERIHARLDAATDPRDRRLLALALERAGR